MISSLRMRFFLLVWPLVVVALALMGSLAGGWSVGELKRMSLEVESVRHLDTASDDLMDSLGIVDRADSVGMVALLDRIVERDTMLSGIVIASNGAGLIATSLAGLHPDDLTLGPGRQMIVDQTITDGEFTGRMRIASAGKLIDPIDDPDPRFVLLVPENGVHLTRPLEGSPPPADQLTKRIGLTLLVGSGVAALLTILLSGRLTGRIEELAVATQHLGSGNLTARVSASGSDEIADLARSFNDMATSLEDSEGQRRRMVTDVAHELRTPLTNLIGLLEASRDGLRPADDELVEILHEEASLLNRLVDDLRDLSLAEAGDLVLSLESIDLAGAIKAAIAGFDRRHDIAYAATAKPVTVRADRRRLGQVLRNLIQNAVTHSPDPGSVVVSGGRLEGGAFVAVRDAGPGIAPDQLPNIWDRFYRTDPSRARDTGGMGLGLSVVKRLMDSMDGSVTVDSTAGEGSVFTIQLPADPESLA